MDTLASKEVVDHILAHHGVLGMKWGVRRGESSTSSGSSSSGGSKKSPTEVTVKTGSSPRGHATIKTHGGHNQPAHPDAIAAKKVEQQLKRSGQHSLSNEQMRKYTERKQLEVNVARLQPPTTSQKVRRGARETAKFFRTPEGQATMKVAKKGAKKAITSKFIRRKLATGLTVAALA